MAERLLAETGCLNKALARTASALRSEGSELVRRAGDVGSLERSFKLSGVVYGKNWRGARGSKRSLPDLPESGRVWLNAWAVLQERLRLAGGTTVERRSLEQRVAEAEATAAREKAEIEEFDRRLKALEQERKDLGERLDKTRALVHELEKSPDRELCRRVHEIWALSATGCAGEGEHSWVKEVRTRTPACRDQRPL